MNVAHMQLAQINIGRILGPMDSPVMAGFKNALDEINALAERSPGFVWRLIGEGNDATSIRPYDDEQMLINMSVWESVETLRAYAYRSTHVNFVRRRQEWFEALTVPYYTLWWIPTGHVPTVWEGKERLEHLRAHGETPHAFSFKRVFEPIAT
ncbi:MAG: DUF3291 domain-containing protein [Anaerolineales bacterium]